HVLVRPPIILGRLGELPMQAELLRSLSSQLVEGGWKVKRHHKLSMSARVYQLPAAGDAENLKADPGNALFWRFNMRRLTAEEVRDSILSVSGSLNSKRGGPGIYPKIPKEELARPSPPPPARPPRPPHTTTP